MYHWRKKSSEFQVKKVSTYICSSTQENKEQLPTTNTEENKIINNYNNNSDIISSKKEKKIGNKSEADINLRRVVISRKRKKRSRILAAATTKKQPMPSFVATATTAASAFLMTPSSSSVPSSPNSSQGERTVGIIVADEEDSLAMNPSSATISHGLISVIGRRRSMEDAVTVVPRLVHLSTAADSEASMDFFAVYDGHGGYEVAQRCKDRLHHLVAAEITAELERSRGGGHDGGGGGLQVDWVRVMASSFARMDEAVEAEVVEETGGKTATMGSTALVALVGKEEVVVANCGDCRAILGSGGAALSLSRDHKPERPDEKERVEAAGGNIVNWDCSRVLGVLATSRSIGDHYLKPYVSAEPEVTVHKRSISDEFLIIASDGLWDVVSNELAYELVKKCFSGQVRRKVLDEVNGNCTAAAATILAELALARGSTDNISVIVVELQRSSTPTSVASSSSASS